MTARTASTPTRHHRPIRRPRAVGFLAAAAILVGLTYVAGAVRAPAPTVVPPAASAGTVPLEANVPATIGVPGSTGVLVPGSVEQLDRSIATWSANLAAEPRDFISATTLAGLYHARGRLTGDLADQQRALAAARAAETAAPAEAGARAIQAAVQLTLHDFTGALATAEALYATHPSQLGALATMADAKVELGRLADARADYARLATQASGRPSTSASPAWRMSPATGPTRFACHALPGMRPGPPH